MIKTIDVIAPVYNEEDCIVESVSQLILVIILKLSTISGRFWLKMVRQIHLMK
jgi:hypothetical protein